MRLRINQVATKVEDLPRFPPPPLDVDHCHTMNGIQQNELRPRKMKNLSVICALVLCFPCCLIRYYRYVPRPILTP